MNDIKKYTKLGVTKIRDGDILEKDDMKSVANLSKELQRVFEVHQMWRTETEMRYSVLNDTAFPTPASKYWQCIREQNSFWEELVRTSLEYQKTQGELDLLELEYDEIKGKSKKANAQRKIKDAEIKEKQFLLMNMRLQAHDRVREIKLWEKLKDEQKSKADFNIEDVNSHQIESYALRWAKEPNPHAKENLETLEKEMNLGN